MSTKIYHGFRFKSTSILENLELLKSHRESFVVESNALFSKEIMKSHIEMNDNHVMDKQEPIIKSRWALRDDYEARRLEQPQSLVVSDFSMSVSLLPIPRHLLGLYFIHEKELIQKFMSLDFVEEYHYQNQCDRPDHISGKRWGTREKHWDMALTNKFSTAMKAGLSYTLVDHSELYVRGNADDMFSFEDRAKNSVENAVIIHIAKEVFGKEEGYRAYWNAMGYIRKPENQETVTELRNRFMPDIINSLPASADVYFK